MNELFKIAAICAYLFPNADTTTNELCYALLSYTDTSKLTHETNIGKLFMRPVIDHPGAPPPLPTPPPSALLSCVSNRKQL